MTIVLNDVEKSYKLGKGRIIALNKINISIHDGELLAVVGRSGSGKTTLLNVLGLLDGFESGEYYLDGVNVNSIGEKERAQLRNRKIGFIVQDFALIDDFTAAENVAVPLEYRKDKLKKDAKEMMILSALEKVAMQDRYYQPVSEMSGGERQRISIARAVINQPDIILADEPTGALDSKTASIIMDMLKKLNDEGKTVIIVTHDMQIAKQCKRKIEISDGTVISDSQL